MTRAVVGLLLWVAGCTAVPPYHCTNNGQCKNGKLQGVCEPNGSCSFPDEACPSHQRYAGAGSTECTPAGQDCIVQMIGGGTTEQNLDVGHTCVRKTDGTVWCWGDNSFGQLGSDVGATSAKPVQVGLPTGAVAARIASGEIFACAQLDDGAVYCWGDNRSGQLGVGLAAGDHSVQPLPVATAPNAKALGAGGAHACLIAAADGTAHCWGENGDLQISPDAADPQPTPFPVAGLTSGTDIGAGDQHTCALVDDTSVRCWGSNQLGQIGQGDGSAASYPMPVVVKGLLSAQAIRLGDQHTCALLTDSSLLCWGTNVSGTVGNNSDQNANLPVNVLDSVTAVATSGDGKHTCAVRMDDTLWCWGNNDSGQVGVDPATAVKLPVPTQVALSSVKMVGTGAHHSCAVTLDGAVWCWGSNHSGQLGLTGTTGEILPRRMSFSCQ